LRSLMRGTCQTVAAWRGEREQTELRACQTTGLPEGATSDNAV
jgi:hypothetical protein